MKKTVWMLAVALLWPRLGASPVRLKDLASLEGVRENQLVGYGLVVGLAGTGDKRQTVFTAQTLTNLLSKMGVTINPTAIQVKNIAAVVLTATLPAYAQPGTRIDITAATIGDASNLQGGQLLLTPLKGADGQVYAVAQGPVLTSGFAAGRATTSQTVNHPTTGRIPNGAIVERASPSPAPQKTLRLQLHQSDFTTAARVVEAINRKFALGGAPVAKAENAGLVTVDSPPLYSARHVEFIAELENIQIEADRRAKIILNERTGTIVLGKEVRIAPVAILHGSLTVEVQTTFAVSQPNALANGDTKVVPQTGVGVKEDKARNLVLKEGATIEELVRALSAIGSTPREVIAILQSLKSAGAIEADLEVI
jgi:flagellar P-ring protein precursor FlgI